MADYLTIARRALAAFPTNEIEPPKPPKPTFEGFEGSTSGQMQNFSDAPPDHDPAAWAEDFDRWATTECVFRDRTWNGIGCLHVHFCEWAITESVPCTRRTFETLLLDQGFSVADGQVHGLILKQDLKPGCILHPDVLLGEESDPPDIIPTVDRKRSRRSKRRA